MYWCIGIFLGHNFTSVDGFYDENFDMKNSTLQEAKHFVSYPIFIVYMW